MAKVKEAVKSKKVSAKVPSKPAEQADLFDERSIGAPPMTATKTSATRKRPRLTKGTSDAKG